MRTNASPLRANSRMPISKMHPVCACVTEMFAHVRERFEFFVGVARNDARGCRGGDSAQTARVGHDDAFYVFEDIAAYRNLHAFGQASERFSRERGTVGDGDRLGAAHCGQQFVFENSDVVFV